MGHRTLVTRGRPVVRRFQLFPPCRSYPLPSIKRPGHRQIEAVTGQCNALQGEAAADHAPFAHAGQAEVLRQMAGFNYGNDEAGAVAVYGDGGSAAWVSKESRAADSPPSLTESIEFASRGN